MRRISGRESSLGFDVFSEKVAKGLGIIAVIGLVVGCVPIPSCQDFKAVRGSLYVGWSDEAIKRIVFPSGQEDMIFLSRLIRYGAPNSNGPTGTLIMSGGNPVSLWEVRIDSGEIRYLRPGIHATWEPVTDSLVFWFAESRKIGDHYLYIAPRGNPDVTQKFCRAPSPVKGVNGMVGDYLSAPINLGFGRLAVLNETHQVCVLDVAKGVLTPTHHSDCWPQAARKDGHHLFCTDTRSWDVFEVDVDSTEKVQLHGLKGTGFVFIEEPESLMYTFMEGHVFPVPHERTVTRLYDLRDGSICNLDIVETIFPGKAVWLAE